MEIKRFAIYNADTAEHVASVEACSEQAAIDRFSLVKPLVRTYHIPGTGWHVLEMDPREPNLVPLFNNGFFQVLESVEARRH